MQKLKSHCSSVLPNRDNFWLNIRYSFDDDSLYSFWPNSTLFPIDEMNLFLMCQGETREIKSAD